MADITICLKCEYILPGDNPLMESYLCSANPKTDYVTGETGYSYCQSQNSGNCERFKPKPTDHDPQADEAWAGEDGDE